MARMNHKVALVALWVGLAATSAGAEGDPLGVDDMAAAIVEMTTPVWTGPRTAAPDDTPRPEDVSTTIHSDTELVAVHAPRTVDWDLIEKALRALEFARGMMAGMGWPDPLPDGRLGGGPSLDLYFAPSDLPTAAHSDDLPSWSFLDRASAFAVVDPATPSSAIEACVTAAYAEALLLSADPAEARTWRRATAAWITWLLTGSFGCEDGVWEQQAEPWRSWINGGAEIGAGGALLLAYLSARHDDGEPTFVRDAWLLASQRTWEGDGLRAEPDLWAAIDTAVSRSGDRLTDNVRDLAVQRWFVGRGPPPTPLIASIDSDAKVPVMRELQRLPTRAVARTPLEPYGSAYTVLERSAWGPESQLRAWLKGEYGVNWSLTALQLDAHGRELRRISAPSTDGDPTAYVPVELDRETNALLLVVTNLSSRLPDADHPDANTRAFELTLDRARD